jgi:hypothetical protein
VYMSVANGGTALCRASVRISVVVTVAVPAARPAGALVDRGTDESREQSSTHRLDQLSSHSDRGNRRQQMLA